MPQGPEKTSDQEAIEIVGRFGSPTSLILTSLLGGPKHGYGLIKDVQDFSGVSIGPGTLYEALSRLEDRGLVEALPADERRRPYRITDAGSTALSASLAYTERAVKVARQRLRPSVAKA